MINGIILKSLTTHPDERGFFREVARASDLPEQPLQLSHSFMHAGVIKAWHYHLKQWDWWYVVSGRLKVALYDPRVDLDHVDAFPLALQDPRLDWHFSVSPTVGELAEFILGDEPALLAIPPGVAHGCKALTDSHLLYLTSQEYDGSDEGRIPHDDPTIGYDWLKREIK